MARTRDEIVQRLADMHAVNERLADKAEAMIEIEIDGPIQFLYEISAPTPTLTSYEQAQSLCFFTKYASLPEVPTIEIKEHNGRYYPDNIDDFRHLLNEYRPIIQNEKDSTHFQNVHGLCRRKLRNTDHSIELSVTVIGSDGADITDAFTNMLNQKVRSLRWLLKQFDFDYIYNGILQHSDHRYTNRYISEYSSGELHYAFINHSVICDAVKRELYWHNRILATFAAVGIGPL